MLDRASVTREKDKIMSQFYFDPSRENDEHALPDGETFRGYRHECRECDTERPLFPDYYGVLHPNSEECENCGAKGLHCIDTKVAWYYWTCFPGCLPDGEPIGPFETEADALEDAREGME